MLMLVHVLNLRFLKNFPKKGIKNNKNFKIKKQVYSYYKKK